MKEKKIVLVAEDDEFFRAAVVAMLMEAGYEVLEAPDGKSAREILAVTKCDVILSDVQMPHWTGVDLLEWCVEQKPIPFILMTGFSYIKETERAAKLGVDHFLTKPFNDTQLLEELKTALNITDEPEPEAKEKPADEYCKVSLEDFVTEKAIEMDIFIKLNERKYIKIVHSGGKIPSEKIQQYKDKGISQLYIKKEDFGKIVDFNIMLSKLVIGSAQVGSEKKQRFLAHTGATILEDTFVNGVDEKAFGNAKDFLMTSIELLSGDKQTFDLLQILNEHTDTLYAHSLGVSLYSVMIAQTLGWTSTPTLFKLSFGGLMHDVGLKEIDKEILDKPRPLLSYAERQLIETHPLRGKEILEALKAAPVDVVNIAYQHHENILGQGYPRRLGKLDIHPLAHVVKVADEFCYYALKGPDNPGLPGPKAIELMTQLKKDTLEVRSFDALRKLVTSDQSKAAS